MQRKKNEKTANALFFKLKICSTQQRSTKLEHITMKQLEELKKSAAWFELAFQLIVMLQSLHI